MDKAVDAINIMQISPKYQMSILKNIENAIWNEYKTYEDVRFYIEKWQEWYDDFNVNFHIAYKENSTSIDLRRTLHNIDGETLIKIAIDIGIDTPDFLPSIPTFRNELKSDYHTANTTFEKAYKAIESDPDTAIGLANSALESIIKEILKDQRITTQWKNGDTLYKLASALLSEFKMFPNSQLPDEIKTIGCSLLGASKAIEVLRSTKTNFHGKTEDDYIIRDSLYTYFVINSVCTIGLFLISFYKLKFPKEVINNTLIEDDLPF